jgi:hypothetical protein
VTDHDGEVCGMGPDVAGFMVECSCGYIQGPFVGMSDAITDLAEHYRESAPDLPEGTQEP